MRQSTEDSLANEWNSSVWQDKWLVLVGNDDYHAVAKRKDHIELHDQGWIYFGQIDDTEKTSHSKNTETDS